MLPERCAFLAGLAWLTHGPQRAPMDANELAELVDADAHGADGLAFVRACVPVVEALQRMFEIRRRTVASGHPRWVALLEKREWERKNESEPTSE